MTVSIATIESEEKCLSILQSILPSITNNSLPKIVTNVIILMLHLRNLLSQYSVQHPSDSNNDPTPPTPRPH